MGKRLDVVVKESVEELEALEKKQTEVGQSKRVQALWQWKVQPKQARQDMAKQLRVTTETLLQWAKRYNAGGLEALLAKHAPGIREGQYSCLTRDAYHLLSVRLQGEGFASYKEAWLWLRDDHAQVSLQYNTLRLLIRRTWGGRLKVPRPVHEKKKRGKKKRISHG